MDHDDANWTEEYQLVPHPDFPPPEGISFNARAGREGGALHLHFSQFGDEEDTLIDIQPSGKGGRTDNLWKHTCFEAFVHVGTETGYSELNFSNWGEWAAYAFDAPRQGMRDLTGESEPLAWLNYKGDGGDGVYHRAFSTIDLFDPSTDWHLNLSAVIEAKDGTKSYWALAHAPGPPDFHNRDCFIATLPAPTAA